jgi:hypothetical protein
MSSDKLQEVGGGSVWQAEIFRDRSEGVGAEQGLELFSEGGRTRPARPSKTFTEAAHDIPVFAETDVLVVGGGPGGPRRQLRPPAWARMCCWSSATII